MTDETTANEAAADPKAQATARAQKRAAAAALMRGSCPLYNDLAEAVFTKGLKTLPEVAEAIGTNPTDLGRQLNALPKEELEALVEKGGLVIR